MGTFAQRTHGCNQAHAGSTAISNSIATQNSKRSPAETTEPNSTTSTAELVVTLEDEIIANSVTTTSTKLNYVHYDQSKIIFRLFLQYLLWYRDIF